MFEYREKEVYMLNARDCAGNLVGRDIQFGQILEPIQTIRSWNIKVDITGLWIDEKWVVYESKENSVHT